MWGLAIGSVYVHECFAYVCMCTACMPDALRGQNSLYHLELDLQMVVSHHVGAGNQIQVFCKSNKCSQLPLHLSSSLLAVLKGGFPSQL